MVILSMESTTKRRSNREFKEIVADMLGNARRPLGIGRSNREFKEIVAELGKLQSIKLGMSQLP